MALRLTLLGLLCLSLSARGDLNPSSAFVPAVFATPPGPKTATLAGETARDVAGILGHPYPRPAITYWRAEGKTVWILEARGKSHLITAGFVVAGGKIEKGEVLAYREDRGREVRSRRFLDQFAGAALGGDRKLDRSIDGITGATISVSALKNMARLALYLDSVK
jgi:hypothetical protein